MRILNKRVLLRVDTQEDNVTESGITLSLKPDPKGATTGTVVQCGEKSDHKELLQVGVKVRFEKYGGSEIVIEGETLLLIGDHQIEAVL